MRGTEPTCLSDEEFIKYAALFISDGDMPVNWQKEMLKRYLFFYALLQEINAQEKSDVPAEQMYLL